MLLLVFGSRLGLGERDILDSNSILVTSKSEEVEDMEYDFGGRGIYTFQCLEKVITRPGLHIIQRPISRSEKKCELGLEL